MIEQIKRFLLKHSIPFDDQGSIIWFSLPSGARGYISQVDNRLYYSMQAKPEPGSCQDIIDFLHLQFKIKKQLELFQEVQND